MHFVHVRIGLAVKQPAARVEYYRDAVMPDGRKLDDIHALDTDERQHARMIRHRFQKVRSGVNSHVGMNTIVGAAV